MPWTRTAQSTEPSPREGTSATAGALRGALPEPSAPEERNKPVPAPLELTPPPGTVLLPLPTSHHAPAPSHLSASSSVTSCLRGRLLLLLRVMMLLLEKFFWDFMKLLLSPSSFEVALTTLLRQKAKSLGTILPRPVPHQHMETQSAQPPGQDLSTLT